MGRRAARQAVKKRRTMRKRRRRAAALKDNRTPLCIRFATPDLESVRGAAYQEGVQLSVWIREVALLRAAQVAGKKTLPPIDFRTTAHGFGNQVCVRFQDEDLERIREVASSESTLPSTWVRSAAIARAAEVMRGASATAAAR